LGPETHKGKKAKVSATGPKSMFSRVFGGLMHTPTPPPGVVKSKGHSAAAASTQNKHNNHTANALVAYLEEGIEVIHMFSGRTLCKLHLPAHQVHADVNGDGVVDHIQVHTGAMTEDETGGSGSVNVHSETGFGSPARCRSRARSGIPPRDHLFEASICRVRKFSGNKGSAVLRQHAQNAQHQPIEVLPPAVLPLPSQYGGYGDKRHRRALLAYLTSMGEVTAIGPLGEALWHGFYPTTWPVNSDEDIPVVPTMATMALRRHGFPTALLLGGSTTATIISEHGNTLETMRLPTPPVAPLIIEDFTGDGYNDIIVITASGVYGYAQVPHIGGFALSGILLTLIIAMGIVYYTQQLASGQALGGERPARKLRSTDYVD
jgi:hypothetical protein